METTAELTGPIGGSLTQTIADGASSALHAPQKCCEAYDTPSLLMTDLDIVDLSS